MCCSDLLFVRGIQSEESSLKVKGDGPQQLQTLDKVMCCIKVIVRYNVSLVKSKKRNMEIELA